MSRSLGRQRRLGDWRKPMECEYLRQLVTKSMVERLRVTVTRRGCRIELPLLQSSGDAIAVYVEGVGDGLTVHDGGHIYGLLFDAGPAGASPGDSRTVNNLVENCGLVHDRNRGFVFAKTDASSLSYWLFELGRAIAVASSVIPTHAPRARRSRRLGPRLASALAKRLLSEGLMEVVHPAMTVKGVSEREFRVDFSYTLPPSPFQNEKTVYIFAVDLDVKDPLRVANRGLITATELGGTATEPLVRLVYSSGDSKGVTEPARRLIQAAGRRDLLEDYFWDDSKAQSDFLNRVEQEVAPLMDRDRPVATI